MARAGDELGSGGRERGHLQYPGLTRVHCGQRRLGIDQAVQQGAGVIGEQLPGRGEADPRPAGSSSTVLVSRSRVVMCWLTAEGV